MAEQHHHIHYSRSDIDRYLRGSMSATEMHELEKAALQDPFLADALEGYADADAHTSMQHLEEISMALLQPAKEEAKVVPLPQSSYRQWMKIAAAVIVLASTGMVGWYFIQRPQQVVQSVTPLSKTDHPIQVVPPPPAAMADSIKPAAPQAETPAPPSLKYTLRKAGPEEIVTAPPAADNAEITAMRERKQEAATIVATTPAVGSHQAEAPKTLPEPDPVAIAQQLSGRVAGLSVSKQRHQQQRDTASLNEVVVIGYGNSKRKNIAEPSIAANADKQVYLLKGTVLDSKGQPLANATVKPIKGFTITTTNQQGVFNLRSKDSAATVRISSIGFEQAEARVNSQAMTRVRLEESDQSLSEVVVTEMFSRKKEAAVTPAASDTTYPAGGWQSFQEYVAKKLNRAVDTTGGDQRFADQEIELEFLVEKDGNPRNVRIIRSTDNTVNNQAIEALKNGPRWITSSRKKKARVIVRF